ncbi:MAG: hypothetical protein LBL43_06145 [Treponema sp.]|jgi:hypothetical protein|nr:hypothetical protein [Treponema sp.]
MAALFLSCNRTEPRIAYGFIELVYFQGEGRAEERYSFFILPEDDDGLENLDELYLYHDREGLRWLIGQEDWVQYEEEGKTWIGSRAIAMTDDEDLPRGQYRAVLINKGGEKSERHFTFDGPEDPRHPFPYLTVTGGRYLIESQYPQGYLLCYDGEGNLLQTITGPPAEGSLADLKLSDAARSMALWARDDGLRCSSLTEAVPLR